MTQNRRTKWQPNEFDVVVAGGGPAGSTASTLLAQWGHRVLLLERDKHPRFHIGESMLPRSEPVIERLGVDWARGNLHKYGAEFIDERQDKQILFPLSGPKYHTYQIERSGFDQRLFENASCCGVQTQEKECVVDVSCVEQGVSVETDLGDYRSRYFIDATGRRAIMGRKHQSIKRIHNLGRFALYSRFCNVFAEPSQELFETGNIKVLSVDIGWIWVIPLVDHRLSIGLVVQQSRPIGESNSALFQRYVDQSPLLSRLLYGADMEFDICAEADFSFENENRYGMRFACCGDAAGFLDPVFSSGVFLALTGAARIAGRLHHALLQGWEADPHLHREDDKEYMVGFRTLQLIVERFYQSDLVHNLFFEAARDEEVKKEISAILSGDLWSGNNLFQKSLLSGRRAVAKGAGEI